MIIEPAPLEDAQEILALQKLAYLSEAEIHDDYTIPPLHQNLEETEAEFKDQCVLKATVDGRLIGSVVPLHLVTETPVEPDPGDGPGPAGVLLGRGCCQH
jgi:hypothetical protein